ncbi:MAG: hypothetical protein WA673_23655, partial [Candidatus Acidiferrales bacterium]
MVPRITFCRLGCDGCWAAAEWRRSRGVVIESGSAGACSRLWLGEAGLAARGLAQQQTGDLPTTHLPHQPAGRNAASDAVILPHRESKQAAASRRTPRWCGASVCGGLLRPWLGVWRSNVNRMAH